MATWDRALSPTLLLHTFENQGGSTTGGLEVEGSGKLGAGLSARLSASIAYGQIERSSTAGQGARSGYNYSLRGNIDWRPTEADLFQVSGSYGGRQLTAQGWRLPGGAVNIGYRRKLRTDLVFTATVSDAFASARRVNILDAPTLFGETSGSGPGRIVTLGLTRHLGGPAREAAFEYVN